MYTLHTSPLSQHGRRVVALLEQAKLPYSIEPVALERGEHLQPAYAQLNPNRQVPTFVTGDTRLHESNAILRYLCNAHALTDWYPADPLARAAVDQWLDWNQCRLMAPVTELVVNVAILGDRGDPALIERCHKLLPERLAVLEAHLDGRAFVASHAAPTIADLSVASNITQLGFANAVPDTPEITRWYASVAALPGFAASLPPSP